MSRELEHDVDVLEFGGWTRLKCYGNMLYRVNRWSRHAGIRGNRISAGMAEMPTSIGVSSKHCSCSVGYQPEEHRLRAFIVQSATVSPSVTWKHGIISKERTDEQMLNESSQLGVTSIRMLNLVRRRSLILQL